MVEPIANPYRPGAGRRPPVLAGRQPLLDAFEVVRQRAETYGEGDRSWILNGRRGVGKTVLLNQLWTQVSGRGWISAKVEASWHVPFPVVLTKALVQAMRTATGRHPVPKLRRLLGVFQAFSLQVDPALGLVSLGADVDLVRGVADSGRLGDDLTALLQVLGETSADLGIGTLLLIDELQEAKPDELTAINMAIHQFGQGPTPLPVMLVGAGLPSLPAQLGEATSYAERLYDYRTIGLLDPPSSRLALVGPTSELGVTWEPGRPRGRAHPGRGLPLLPPGDRQARLGLRPDHADHARGRRGGQPVRPRGARRRALPHPLGARDPRAARAAAWRWPASAATSRSRWPRWRPPPAASAPPTCRWPATS